MMHSYCGIPTEHPGIHYIEFMAALTERRRPKCYLEVGVSAGVLLQHIRAEHVIAVDPSFSLNVNIMNLKKSASIFQACSDEFFSSENKHLLLGSVDLAFLDGMHNWEFLLRDFYNTERICNRNGLIILHDCMPLNIEMTHRNYEQALRLGANGSFPTFWTGDVWKVVPVLLNLRPDLRLVFVDAPPTGLVCVTNLDPRSTVLQERYFQIVDELMFIESNTEDLVNYYRSIEIVSTDQVLNDSDQSIFFRA